VQSDSCDRTYFWVSPYFLFGRVKAVGINREVGYLVNLVVKMPVLMSIILFHMDIESPYYLLSVHRILRLLGLQIQNQSRFFDTNAYSDLKQGMSKMDVSTVHVAGLEKYCH